MCERVALGVWAPVFVTPKTVFDGKSNTVSAMIIKFIRISSLSRVFSTSRRQTAAFRSHNFLIDCERTVHWTIELMWTNERMQKKWNGMFSDDVAMRDCLRDKNEDKRCEKNIYWWFVDRKNYALIHTKINSKISPFHSLIFSRFPFWFTDERDFDAVGNSRKWPEKYTTNTSAETEFQTVFFFVSINTVSVSELTKSNLSTVCENVSQGKFTRFFLFLCEKVEILKIRKRSK